MIRTLATLAALTLSASASSQGWRPASEVEIRLERFNLTPKTIRMDAGQATRLRIVNTGRRALALQAPKFFAAARIRPRDASRLVDGVIVIEAGRTREMVVVPVAGRYVIASRGVVARTLGVRATIVVEPGQRGD